MSESARFLCTAYIIVMNLSENYYSVERKSTRNLRVSISTIEILNIIFSSFYLSISIKISAMLCCGRGIRFYPFKFSKSLRVKKSRFSRK